MTINIWRICSRSVSSNNRVLQLKNGEVQDFENDTPGYLGTYVVGRKSIVFSKYRYCNHEQHLYGKPQQDYFRPCKLRL
jgi:hypothetical protein